LIEALSKILLNPRSGERAGNAISRRQP